MVNLNLLCHNGYQPDIILDIGANIGNWTHECLITFPFSKYYLFEPVQYTKLQELINDNIKVYNVLLDETEREVEWYQQGGTGDSMYKEKSIFYKDCVPVLKRTTTLDNIIDFPLEGKKILMKIDCQGAEIPILKGSTRILEHVDFIYMEIPLFGQYNENVPNFLSHIQYMDSIGFIPYEIHGWHIINNFSMQIDILFISKSHQFNQEVQNRLSNSFSYKYNENSS